MKKIQFICALPLMASALLFAGCNGNKQTQQTEDSTTQTEAVQAVPTLGVDQLMTDAEGLVGQTVTVEGLCTHICAHGGCKIFLMGSDEDHTIRIEATDAFGGAFSKDCVNANVSVTGKVMETRIDEAALVKMETESAESTGEKHGNGEAGCASEQKAMQEKPANGVKERVADFRRRIAEEKAKSGKEYLSFYYVEAESYEIK